jgi:hypothetical protein
LPLLLQYSTDEIPSQEVPFSSVPVFFAHDFEGFNSGIDIFDDDSLIRQRPIKCLPLRRQWIILASLIRYSTILVQGQQSLVAAVRQQQNLPS